MYIVRLYLKVYGPFYSKKQAKDYLIALGTTKGGSVPGLYSSY